MKGKSGKGPPSTDLLVCFPTRAHLTLMPPKSINSPVRPPSETSSHHHHHHNHNHNNHQKQPLHRLHRRGRSFGIGQSSSNSPTLWSKNKPNNNDISEPTSPKVTCAGQIKVRPKSGGSSSCKNWQSVMEQIERIQNTKKQKKKPNWVESLGLKKDVMQFLTCMRNIRFDFRCFGAFPTTAISSDDEDDEDDDEDDIIINNDDHQQKQQHGQQFQEFRNTGGVEKEEEDDESSRTYFSKWYMVLQDDIKKEKTFESYRKSTSDEIIAPPPPNALLLMRCRSAPAKSWLEEKQEEEEEENEKKKAVKEEEEEKTEVVVAAMDDKIEKNENNMILRYGAGEHDLYKFSSDIAKETWVVGGIKGSLSRSRSWKR